jgi:hypothetical protein
MLPTVHLSPLIAAAALLAVPAPAFAVATASGTMTELFYELVDLRPADSISPDISFANLGSGSFANAGASIWDWQTNFKTPTSAVDASAGRSANAWTDGKGNAYAGISTSVASDWTQAGGYTASFDFTLTPWTGVIWSTSFTGTATTTVGYDGMTSENAQAVGWLSLRVLVDGGYELHEAQRAASADALWNGSQWVGTSDSFSGSFSLGFANMSNDSANAQMSSFVYSNGVGLPVPEPATFAMLLAGLAGFGVVILRRRRD